MGLLHPFNHLFPGQGKLALEQQNHFGFYWSKRWGGSGISWTICKSFTPCFRQITTPVPHHSVFTGRMPFLPPNQQCQSTEGTRKGWKSSEVTSWYSGILWCSCMSHKKIFGIFYPCTKIAGHPLWIWEKGLHLRRYCVDVLCLWHYFFMSLST